jgi:hypothetical protein
MDACTATGGNMKYYAGIGSRCTPENILTIMMKVARKLEILGYILRSGGAQGADKAFESGVVNPCNKEIYLASQYVSPDAINLAKQFHPAWNRISSEYVKKLHGRNAYQILGKDLNTPSAFVVCWTQDGCKTHEARGFLTGGTGTAISIAHSRGITIFNLANPEDMDRIIKFVNKEV